MGAGIGTGGNSQYLGIKLYHHAGFVQTFVQRNNPDNDYVWFMHFGKSIEEKRPDEHKIKALMNFGLNSLYFVNSSISIQGMLSVSVIHNPVYVCPENDRSHSIKLLNFYSSLLVKWNL